MKTSIALCLIVGLLLCGVSCWAVYSLTDKLLFGDLCGNEIFEQTSSPDGRHKAIIFERDCGATTDFSTQVSVLPAHQAFSNTDKGTAFICDHGTGRADAKINWLDASHLEVQHQSNLRIFRQEQYVEGVTITYVTLP